MSEQDKTLMAEYGITSTVKKVYTYKGYRYDRLSDAIYQQPARVKRNQDNIEQIRLNCF
jgi:hypothetical protein